MSTQALEWIYFLAIIVHCQGILTEDIFLVIATIYLCLRCYDFSKKNLRRSKFVKTCCHCLNYISDTKNVIDKFYQSFAIYWVLTILNLKTWKFIYMICIKCLAWAGLFTELVKLIYCGISQSEHFKIHYKKVIYSWVYSSFIPAFP